MTSAPTKPVELPEWAAGALEQLKVPESTVRWRIHVAERHPPDQHRCALSPTISVLGSIKHEGDLQSPAGKDGGRGAGGAVLLRHADTGPACLSEGAGRYRRHRGRGYRFSLSVLKENFTRRVQLLADNELHPALPAKAFDVVKQQTVELVWRQSG